MSPTTFIVGFVLTMTGFVAAYTVIMVMVGVERIWIAYLDASSISMLVGTGILGYRRWRADYHSEVTPPPRPRHRYVVAVGTVLVLLPTLALALYVIRSGHLSAASTILLAGVILALGLRVFVDRREKLIAHGAPVRGAPTARQSATVIAFITLSIVPQGLVVACADASSPGQTIASAIIAAVVVPWCWYRVFRELRA